MLDASLECPIIHFTHHHVHVAGVLVDQRLPQGREIRDGRCVSLPVLRRQQHRRLTGLQRSEEGNILAPVDAKLNCSNGAVTNGVVVERIMAATKPARHKLLILDACRDNPLDEVCPNLKGKKLSFTRIEVGAMRGSLLVTSTQS